MMIRRREHVQTDQETIAAIDVVGRQNTNTICRIVHPVFAFPSSTLRRHPGTQNIAMRKTSYVGSWSYFGLWSEMG